MALRESECLLVRRVADRGIDKNISDSRVRGDRFHRDRRSAGRGNEIGNRDPRDIIEIKRLKRRVRDLELQQQIKRLRQRIRYLELQREVRKVETESSIVVWDEGGDGEEHPFSRHPHWFSELTYLDFPSEGKPVFDEDGINFDVEECSIVQKLLDGVSVKEDEHIFEEPFNNDDSDNEEEASTIIYDDFLMDAMADNGGVMVGIADDVVATNDHAVGGVGLENPLMQPIFVEGLNINEYLMISPNIMDAQMEGNKLINVNFHVANNMGDVVGKCDLMKVDNMVDKNGASIRVRPIGTCGLATHVKYVNGSVDPSSRIKNKEHDVSGNFGSTHANGKKNNGGEPYMTKPSLLECVTNNFGSQPNLAKPEVNIRGTYPALGQTTGEVELFQLVVIIINQNRVDFPFDPGGFGTRQNSRTSFFSKVGSMMQEH